MKSRYICYIICSIIFFLLIAGGITGLSMVIVYVPEEHDEKFDNGKIFGIALLSAFIGILALCYSIMFGVSCCNECNNKEEIEEE